MRPEQVALNYGLGVAVIAQCRDISASGAFVLTTLKPPMLAPVEVLFPKAQKAYQAHIVRIGPEGIGLEWEEFCPEILDIPPAAKSEVRADFPERRMVRDSLR
jgi:hypothetical protein